jgi:DNA-binding NarL/FixJ family response regulator
MKYPESYVRALDPDDQRRARLREGSNADHLDLLREQAIQLDACSSAEVSLSLLWREFVHGLCKVADGFFTEDRCYLIIESRSATAALEGRRLDILAAVLCGVGQKNIAMDMGLAPSTIALNARLGLESLGIGCKPSRAHPLLMLAAKAGAKQDHTLTATVSSLTDGERDLRVISIQRPDRKLFRLLPPAELSVIRLLVEGLPYSEIAHRRETSTRTIANQITAVFRRLRVSGRNELLSRLFFAERLERTPIPEPIHKSDSEAPPPTVRAIGMRPALRSA